MNRHNYNSELLGDISNICLIYLLDKEISVRKSKSVCRKRNHREVGLRVKESWLLQVTHMKVLQPAAECEGVHGVRESWCYSCQV